MVNIIGIDLGKTITVGTDPEFELQTIATDGEETRIVGARYMGFDSLTARIGRDGNSSLLELRPKGNIDIEKLLLDVGKLMYKVKKKSNCQLVVSGHRFPLGAHIHFAFQDGTSIPHHNYVIQLLDDFIGKRVLCLSGGAREQYKKLGAVEWGKSHGGFEYRTPPSAIFYHPQLTYIVMKIGKSIVEKYFNGGVFNYDKVTFDMYRTICGLSQKEVWLWKGFLKYLHRLILQKQNITVDNAWISDIKVPVKKPGTILITFKDEWVPAIRDDFRKSLKLVFREFEHVSLLLYGLASYRGLASTISIRGFESVQLTNEGVGLPYAFRTNVGTYDSNKMQVLKALKTYWLGRRIN